MQIKYLISVANHGLKQHNLHFQFPLNRNDFSVGEEIITQDHFQLELMNPSSSLRANIWESLTNLQKNY